MNATPVRRCAACDQDWPNSADFNLCPRCQRCTFASTTTDAPSWPQARAELERYKKIRAFDAECDAKAAAAADAWAKEWNALLELTPSIPDPTPPPRKNYGLAGGTIEPPRSDKPYPFQTWNGDDA